MRFLLLLLSVVAVGCGSSRADLLAELENARKVLDLQVEEAERNRQKLYAKDSVLLRKHVAPVENWVKGSPEDKAYRKELEALPEYQTQKKLNAKVEETQAEIDSIEDRLKG